MAANKDSKVAAFLSHHIEACGKTQAQISDEMGIKRSALISLIKQGITKVPVARVPALAKAIDADPVELYRLVMEEYMPDVLKVTDEIYAREKLSPSEREVIERIRANTGGKNFKLTGKAKSALEDFIAEI
jgi:transcriptional regulator with XRE-family HTH domain